MTQLTKTTTNVRDPEELLESLLSSAHWSLNGISQRRQEAFDLTDKEFHKLKDEVLKSVEKRFDQVWKRIVRRQNEETQQLASTWQGLRLLVEAHIEDFQRASGQLQPPEENEHHQ